MSTRARSERGTSVTATIGLPGSAPLTTLPIKLAPRCRNKPERTDSDYRKLSELQGADPMVLVLSRGAFCLKDRQQRRLLVQMEQELKVAYTEIVTISTDAMMEANEMRDGLGAHRPFLIDPERTVQRDLGIVEYTDPYHNPMIPHTLVLEPGLVIYSVYNGYWYWGRLSPAQLRADLRAVTEKVRPDWDITAPGQRDAWERDDNSAFWPYGMSLREVFAAEPSEG
jgi:peroxiredoxin